MKTYLIELAEINGQLVFTGTVFQGERKANFFLVELQGELANTKDNLKYELVPVEKGKKIINKILS